jgi:alpha-beta hydrolase superfamily lysophospholipase
LWLAEFLGARRRPVLIPLNDPTLFTNDSERQQFLREDPLSIRAATTGFLIADQELTRLARASGAAIRCPTLLMLAGRDRIIDNAAMRRFFESIASSEKRLVEFPDAAHTLEFEACFEEFIAALLNWLNQHEKSPGVAIPGL